MRPLLMAAAIAVAAPWSDAWFNPPPGPSSAREPLLPPEPAPAPLAATADEVLALLANYPPLANLSAEADRHRPAANDEGLCTVGVAHRGVCCGGDCGVCGGRGCGADGADASRCCRSVLLRARRACDGPEDVACVLPSALAHDDRKKAAPGPAPPPPEAVDDDDGPAGRVGGGASPTTVHYVVVTTQRTGAHWLLLELGRAACVHAGGEVLLSRAPFEWTPRTRKRALARLYAAEAQEAGGASPKFAAFARAANRSAAAGFPWMLSQRFGDAFDGWFADLALRARVRLVFLARDDVLRLTVSKRSAGDAHPPSVASAQRATAVKLELPTGGALLQLLDVERRKMDDLRRLAAAAAAKGIPVLTTTYEALTADPPKTLGAVRAFLLDGAAADDCGADPRRSNDASVQVHADHPRAYVANWDAVAATLRGTPFERDPGGAPATAILLSPGGDPPPPAPEPDRPPERALDDDDADDAGDDRPATEPGEAVAAPRPPTFGTRQMAQIAGAFAAGVAAGALAARALPRRRGYR